MKNENKIDSFDNEKRQQNEFILLHNYFARPFRPVRTCIK